MFEKVIVGVDGRANGRDAIALATQLVSPDGEMTMAHVHTVEATPSRASNLDFDAAQREESQQILERERLRAGVVAQLASTAAATAAGGLHRLAEAGGYDLLVVGSCAHGLAGRVVLGNEAREALRESPCAVAVAPRHFATHAQPIRRIGIGYNAEPPSLAALALARILATRFGATLHVLSAVNDPAHVSGGVPPLHLGNTIELRLKAASAHMAQLEGVEGTAVYGWSGEALSAFSHGVDLLILGSRHQGRVARMLLGSTGEYVAQHAQCAVLVAAHTAAAEADTRGAHSAQAPVPV